MLRHISLQAVVFALLLSLKGLSCKAEEINGQAPSPFINKTVEDGVGVALMKRNLNALTNEMFLGVRGINYKYHQEVYIELPCKLWHTSTVISHGASADVSVIRKSHGDTQCGVRFSADDHFTNADFGLHITNTDSLHLQRLSYFEIRVFGEPVGDGEAFLNAPSNFKFALVHGEPLGIGAGVVATSAPGALNVRRGLRRQDALAENKYRTYMRLIYRGRNAKYRTRSLYPCRNRRPFPFPGMPWGSQAHALIDLCRGVSPRSRTRLLGSDVHVERNLQIFTTIALTITVECMGSAIDALLVETAADLTFEFETVDNLVELPQETIQGANQNERAFFARDANGQDGVQFARLKVRITDNAQNPNPNPRHFRILPVELDRTPSGTNVIFDQPGGNLHAEASGNVDWGLFKPGPSRDVTRADAVNGAHYSRAYRRIGQLSFGPNSEGYVALNRLSPEGDVAVILD